MAAHKGRGHAGHHLLPPAEGLAQLVDLALVGNGAEGAVHQAHAAGDALVVVDFSPAQLVGLNGVHAAGGGAGAVDPADGPVGTLVVALAALDALALVDVAVLVLIQIDGVFGADVHARVRNTALAAVRDADLLRRAGVAGVRDDVYQGILVVLLEFLGPLNVLADGRGVPGVAHIQAHGQADPLLHNGPLQKHVMTVFGHVALDHLEGDMVCLAGIAALKGQPGNLLEYGASNVVYRAVNSSHQSFLHVPRAQLRPGNSVWRHYIKSPAFLQERLPGKAGKHWRFPAFPGSGAHKHGGAPGTPGLRRRVWREKRNEREMSSLEDGLSITGKYEENPEFL